MEEKNVIKNKKKKIKNNEFVYFEDGTKGSKGLIERMSMGKFEFIENEKQEILNYRQLVNSFPKISDKMLKKFNDEFKEASKFPMFSYIPDIMNDWIKLFFDLELADNNYIENMKLLESKSIKQLTINETLTQITFYIRQERSIMNAINTGLLENLVMHLNECIQ